MRATRPVRSALVACLLALGVLVLAAAPEAWACAVCAGKDDAKVSLALLKGTALLSLLPLAVFAAGAWYLRRRARQLAAAASERADAGARAATAARSS